MPTVRSHDVTFTWSEPDPPRPALAVLLRLVALTDHAYDDGDLSRYLMRRRPDGDWSLTLTPAVDAALVVPVLPDP